MTAESRRGAESCTLRAYRLPGIDRTAPAEAPGLGCAVSFSPDGRAAQPEGAAWTRGGDAYAACRGAGPAASVLVFGRRASRPGFASAGCVPSFRPDGTLTLARDGEVLGVEPGCDRPPPCERVLLTRAALARAAAEHPDAPPGVPLDVQALAWPSSTRVAVLLGLRASARPSGPVQLVAVFDRGRLAWTFPRTTAHAGGLSPSPRGGYLVVEPAEILRPNGSRVGVPPSIAQRATAVAWSPDERWIAFATGTSVVVLRVAELERLDRGGPLPQRATLPLAALDVGWQVPSGE